MTESGETKADDEKAKGSSVEDQLELSAERIRTTAKWLVATFGAIGGVLVTSLQISDIGQLEGSDRIVAAVGVFVALAAVIVIILLASVVLSRGRVALSDLASEGAGRRKKRLVDALDRSPALYAPYNSVAEFAGAVSAEWVKQAKSWLVKQTEEEGEKRAAAEKEFAQTKKVLPVLNRINTRLMATARAEDVRITFGRVRLWIGGLAVVAAIGAGAFAYVNTVPTEEESEPAVAQRPVVAVADLTESGEERLEGSLGAGCDFDHVDVIALSSSEEGWEVVSIGGGGCDTSRFAMQPDDGDVYAEEPGDLDLPDSS